jgi:hypothetical protein
MGFEPMLLPVTGEYPLLAGPMDVIVFRESAALSSSIGKIEILADR